MKIMRVGIRNPFDNNIIPNSSRSCTITRGFNRFKTVSWPSICDRLLLYPYNIILLHLSVIVY